MTPSQARPSKFLIPVRRHKPETIGLHLDTQGWVDVTELLTQSQAYGVLLTRPQLEQIVVTHEKQRFTFSPDAFPIRASQGHAIRVDLGLEA